jgi:hypothetical protein
MIYHFLTGTGSALGSITSSSTFFSFFKAMVVAVPMKLKKSMAAGINWRRTIIAPTMMKIQRAVPAPLRLIALAKAGDAIKVINPTINPTFNPFIFFSIFNSSFLLFSILIIAFGVPIDQLNYNDLKSLKYLVYEEIDERYFKIPDEYS